MSYIVVKDFSDAQDGRFIYRKGDHYPHDGIKPTKERIAELLSGNNQIGSPLIKEEQTDADRSVPRTKKLVRQRASKVVRKNNDSQ